MSKNIFICKNCNKEYHSYKEKSDFCSNECKYDYNHIKHQCDYCGKEHVISRKAYEKLLDGTKKHAYCSKDCANKDQITSVTKICKCCGKEFLAEYSVRDTQIYCSSECYYNYKRINTKLESKICPCCKKEYHTYHHNQVCCSDKCRSILSRNRRICICDNCGETFERIVSEVNKNAKHFCSKKCMYEYSQWDEKDIILLKSNYGKTKVNNIQKMLSKEYTISAIKNKARSIGLQKNRYWTDKENKILFENYSIIPINELLELLPNRTFTAIKDRANANHLQSYFYLNKVYSPVEINYIQENYQSKTNKELADYLGRTESSVASKLLDLCLLRQKEIVKTGYKGLNDFVRSRLYYWKNSVREINDYTCVLTGSRSNLIIHHCRSFNLLMSETIEELDFPIKDNFEEYSDEELNIFLESFFNLQSYYGEYVCITEDVHRLFHNNYGYGDNTIEQWNEFVERFKIGYYDKIA